jgi:hypothetical protein
MVLIGAIVVGCAVAVAVVWIALRGNQPGDLTAVQNTAPPTETSSSVVPGENNNSKSSAANRDTDKNPPSTLQNSPAVDTAPVDTAPVATIDDSSTLWASPTQGSPLSLAYLPGGLQAMLVLRPADLMRQAEAEKIVAALGPEAQAAAQNLEALAGASLADIDQLTVAWVQTQPIGGAWSIQPMYIFRLTKPPEKQPEKSPADQVATAQTDQAAPAGTAAEKSLATYAPASEAGKVLVIGPPEVIAEVTKLAGQPPPIGRDLERLLLTTDDQRLLTLIWSPGSSELASGHEMSGSKWDELLSAARSFFGSDVRAAEISASLTSDNLFAELRIRGPLDRPADAFARRFQQRLVRLPDTLKKYLAGLKLQPYGKEILNRFPQMIKLLGEFTRAGGEGDQTVMRCYLPVAAAHNLLLAGELTLAESANALSGANAADSAGAKPQSISEKLQRKTTLTFVNEPLDHTMALLADDLGIKIEILGPDLQLEGITKNQAIRDLNEKDKPAAEILRNIMSKANPDGKLVYVVKPRAPGGEEVLFITTRAAAKKRGDKLPDDLAKPPEKK